MRPSATESCRAARQEEKRMISLNLEVAGDAQVVGSLNEDEFSLMRLSTKTY
jgi:hypothetical protein